KDDINLYFARQQVGERLSVAKENIPAGFGTPEMGPVSTGLGEVYQFVVRGKDLSPMELRTLLDWQIAYRLRTVPGVVEVNAMGGFAKQYQVVIDPKRLIGYRLPIGDVFEALEKNNLIAGGGYIEHGGESYVIRGEGMIQNPEEIGRIIIDARNGTPITVNQIGEVKVGSIPRIGFATMNGEGEAVVGLTLMLAGENGKLVAERVKESINKLLPSLPPGVTIEPFYDRSDLVGKVIRTVSKNLIEGAILVIAVLFLLLGDLRGGLIVASAIPLSMLIAFTGMLYGGISGNLMSLGAIDFGLIVDGSVVMIENIVRHLNERRAQRAEMSHVILEAGREVLRPIFFAVGIIIIVYLPILTLEGVEGKMFRPMALTVIFALVGSLILTFTLMPVLASFFLRPTRHHETRLVRWIKSGYDPLLTRAVAHPVVTVGIAALVFAGSLLIVPFMGSEFIPKLDEGAIVVQATRPPSISLNESVKTTLWIEKTLLKFPEVTQVVSRTGAPEVATDPDGLDLSHIFVNLKPKEEWSTAATHEELVQKFNERLSAEVPGVVFGFTQPIELRFNELIAGVRADIALKIFGDDLKQLKELGDRAAAIISKVPGAADVRAEQTAGLPLLNVKVDRERAARYGVRAEEIMAAVEAGGAGRVVGTVFEGQRRFELAVRLQQNGKLDPNGFASIPVAAQEGRLIPLGQVANVTVEEGPVLVNREDIQRRFIVQLNVRGRDLGSFIAEAEQAVRQGLKLPTGYTMEWGGQFENLERASARLMIVVPLALFLIFVLLYTSFNSLRPALMIYLNIPLAATGGIVALFVRDLPFSISAGVGFIALFGVAVLNGVVLMSYIQQMREEGMSAREAALHGAAIRLRPVLMTALVASLGFVPMAISTSVGAEVQRPLATVVIGGLITSTLLTLIVLPSLYAWVEGRREHIRVSESQNDAEETL
ncbi:MAG TPA: CusA/CzcA family heavy metal efflux RND transporter, partial [Candidatus Binatia bacterium]|nr:CusA/CzcA family heavy metal efflux RND transporter [Candidatus Binatia bacterium]